MGGVRNFQVCARCRNHGIQVVLKGHKKHCAFKLCDCAKCLVTRDRQSFIAKEIAMHRYEIKSRSGSDDSFKNGLKLNLVRSKSLEEKSSQIEEPQSDFKRFKNRCEVRKDQMCSRCRNHGIVQLLRGHKNACLFVHCICVKCEITKKRREIMAKQIKDYRNVKFTDSSSASSPETPDSPEIIIPNEDDLMIDQFVDYEPLESRDLFFMVQSLYEKYGIGSSEKKIQLVYAVAKLAHGNWDDIEKALEKGEKSFLI